MIWIEMSKDESHGGIGWEFTRCLWSPEYKLVKNKKTNWAYWNCLKSVKAGDIVIHLQGDKIPKFVGYSTAETDGFSTTFRPPILGENWSFADKFNRVNLCNYQTFDSPIALRDLFSEKKEELKSYYIDNQKKDKTEKRLLFYVIQNSNLGRQNGAYLSELDDELYEIIFGDEIHSRMNTRAELFVNTSEGRADLVYRKGQRDFSANVKVNFGNTCCFPDCDIKDKNFLVGSHIARWADNSESRGDISNGLCLCLMHDKAFELGLFTLDENFNVSINRLRLEHSGNPIDSLIKANGKKIKRSIISVNQKYIREHWIRIGYRPF